MLVILSLVCEFKGGPWEYVQSVVPKGRPWTPHESEGRTITHISNISCLINIAIIRTTCVRKSQTFRDSKVHWANMGPTWVLSAPDGPHVGPMNLAIGVYKPSVAPLLRHLNTNKI